MTVLVLESKDVNISCTSTGSPVPIITWTINNQPTTFSQTDNITRAVVTEPDGTFVSIITPGYVISTLNIVDSQYPTHDGVYTCTGINTMDASDNTSSVNITIQVQGIAGL